VGADQKQRDSVWAMVAIAFAALADPAVLDAVSPGPGEQFDPQTFLRPRGTVFLVGTSTGASATAGLVGAFVEDVAEAARRLAAASPGARIDPPLSMILDEAANHPLPSLTSLMSEGGGTGTTVQDANRFRSANLVTSPTSARVRAAPEGPMPWISNRVEPRAITMDFSAASIFFGLPSTTKRSASSSAAIHRRVFPAISRGGRSVLLAGPGSGLSEVPTHPAPVSQVAAPRPAGSSVAATATHASVAAAGSSQVSGSASRRSLLMLLMSW
jgi:hypothetical protein